jgi:hypothetical protein
VHAAHLPCLCRRGGRRAKKLTDFPCLGEREIAGLAGSLRQRSTLDPGQAEFIDKLERKIGALDLARIAPVIGAVWNPN